jgi:uncharacterized protein
MIEPMGWQWRKVLQRCLIALMAMLLMLPVAAGSAIALNKKLSQLAEKTGNEVRFVTIRRFDYGQTASTFTNELFERWFPTPEEQANQTLVLLDTQTKTTGIHTGEKVKAIMSDDIANSIAGQTMLMPIREGSYNQGFLDAADRLALVLSGEPDPGPPQVVVTEVESTFAKSEETDDKSATILVVVLLIAATVIPMATYYWYQRD